MKKSVKKIKLVKGDSVPTKEDISKCNSYTNLDVSNKSEKDWYCLLRDVQGDIEVTVDKVSIMIDNKDFLKDSLFCEWAYIINLDTEKLEIYEGFNKNKKAAGRYAKYEAKDSGEEYYGVKLIKEYNLSEIFGCTEKNFEKLINDMEELERRD